MVLICIYISLVTGDVKHLFMFLFSIHISVSFMSFAHFLNSVFFFFLMLRFKNSFFLFLLAALCGLWDLTFPTRNQTWTPCSGRAMEFPQVLYIF